MVVEYARKLVFSVSRSHSAGIAIDHAYHDRKHSRTSICTHAKGRTSARMNPSVSQPQECFRYCSLSCWTSPCRSKNEFHRNALWRRQCEYFFFTGCPTESLIYELFMVNWFGALTCAWTQKRWNFGNRSKIWSEKQDLLERWYSRWPWLRRWAEYNQGFCRKTWMSCLVT